MLYVIILVIVFSALALLAQGNSDIRQDAYRQKKAFRYSDTGNVEWRSGQGGWVRNKSTRNPKPSRRYERIC